MKLLLILLTAAAVFLCLVLLISYLCYRMAFYAKRQPSRTVETVTLPNDPVYEPFRECMENWIRQTLRLPRQTFTVTSFDGLKLQANYYEYAPGAPIELMFHGYRGSALRDLSGGVERCFRLGRSALIVDQRTSGGSEGHVISFGINEHRDCLTWISFMITHFGPEVKIILTGISMGASTVMMAAAHPLPENVIGVLADCGYTSARQIIQKVIRQMHLPAALCYPFVRLGARIYGHFDLEETSPIKAMEKVTVPVIFYHGEADDFVPCQMSIANYEACASRKKLVLIPGAGHGLCYPVDPERYLSELKDFFKTELSR